MNRARKRDSPVRRRSPSPRRRHRPRKRSEEKVEEHLDPVLEARRKKFESLPNENKKISLKAVKNTIEPVSETGVDIRLDVLSDDSEDSDGQEGRFVINLNNKQGIQQKKFQVQMQFSTANAWEITLFSKYT